MAKTLWHSQLVQLGPVKITVEKEVVESTKKRGTFYATINLNGESRYYHVENDACGEFFRGRCGKQITIIAEGRDADATITLVGQAIGATAATPKTPPAPVATASATAAAGMRAKTIRYCYKAGLPNYSSESIELEVELEPGVKAADALDYARKFVHSQIQWPK